MNFRGSLPAMGGTVLWGRSIKRHNIRYRWIVCNGDSKVFNAVEDTYQGCKVVKLDCVGNGRERISKHFLNLKVRTKKQSQRLLSEGRIKVTQKYYGSSHHTKLSSPLILQIRRLMLQYLL